MQLIKIINARGVIAQYAGEKIAAQTAYKLFNFLKSTDKDEIFYNEKRKEIIDRYAKKDEEGNYVPEGKWDCPNPRNRPGLQKRNNRIRKHTNRNVRGVLNC